MFLGLSSALTSVRRNFLPWIKDGLKLYYPFSKNSDYKVSHASSGSTSFDGTNDYVDTTHVLSSSVLTVSYWINITEDTTYQYHFSARDGANDGLIVYGLDSDQKSLTAKFNSVGTTFSVSAYNTWYHISIVNNGTDLRAYVDGVLANTPVSTSGESMAVTTTTKIGSNELGTLYFTDGSFANFAIWSRALSASEVQGIMYKKYADLGSVDKTSLVSWYGLDAESLGSELVTNGTFDTDTTGWTATRATLSSVSGGQSGNCLSVLRDSGGDQSGYQALTSVTGKTYKLTAWVKSGTSGADTFHIQLATGSDYERADGTSSDTWTQYSTIFTATATTMYVTLRKSSSVSGSMLFDGATLSEVQVEDLHGTNEGSIYGATTNATVYGGNAPQIPRILDVAQPKQAVQLADGSTSFDGTDDYISVADADNLSFGDGSTDSAFTISMWVNMGDVTSLPLVSKGVFNTSGEWILHTGSDDKIYFMLLDESGATTYERIFTDTAITSYENQWTHITGTYDGRGGSSALDGLKIYINGSSVATTGGGGGTYVAMENLGADVHIGRDDATYFNGSMANVGIWSSALTQTQVQELMFTEKYAGLSADLRNNLVSWYDLGATSLGSELVTASNAVSIDSEADTTTGWTTNNATISSVGTDGGVSVHSGSYQMKIVDAGSASKAGYSLTTVIGKAYRFSAYLYTASGQGASTTAGLEVRNASISGTLLANIGQATVDAYTLTEVDFVATGTTTFLNITPANATADITYADSVSIKELTLDDSQGTNHGSPVGTTTTTGYTSSPHGVVDPINYGTLHSGTALSFDGSNDYVSVADDASLDVLGGDFTIGFWIKSEGSVSSLESPFSRYLTSGEHGIYTYISHTNGSVSLRFNDSVNAEVVLATTGLDIRNDGKWHHIVWSMDRSGNGLVFGDGALLSTVDISARNATCNIAQTLNIGANSSGSQLFDGKISSVKIFNSALTLAQIQEMYLNPEQILPTGVASSNLKLWLPLQEGSGTTNYDGSGNNNDGTISGATWVKAETEIAQVGLVRQNKPMVFDGSDDYVALSAFGSAPTAMSICFWVYPKSWETDTGGWIIDSGSLEVVVGSANATQMYFNHENANHHRFAPPAVNTWTHVVATWTAKDANALVYFNGVAQSDVSSDNYGTIGAGNQIGRRNNGSYNFDGLISEVAVWDEVLTATEVTALYNSGTPLDASADSGNYASSIGLQGYWRNDGDTTWTDRANTGVASFDGTGDYISLPSGVYTRWGNADSFSISIWFHYNGHDMSGGSECIFGLVGNDSNARPQIALVYTSSDRLVITVREDDSNDGNAVTTDSALSVGFHHAVITVEGGSSPNVTLYLDNTSIGSDNTNSLVFVGSDFGEGNIGGLGVTGSASDIFFTGQVSGTHIFDVVLTASEVSELYAIDKRSSISGHSQFGNCVGSWLMGAGSGDTTSTIQDQTSENNDATVTNATLVGYNDGTVAGSPTSIVLTEGITSGRDSQGFYLTDTDENVLTLNGAEYVEVPDSEALDLLSAGFSVEAWVNIKSLDDYNPIVTQWHSTDNGNSSWTLETVGSDLTFYMRDGGSNKGAVSSSTATLDVWRHVVGVFEGDGVSGGLKVYVDGVIGGTTQTVTTSQQSAFNIFIGEFANKINPFNGKIDDVRIYSDALSATEVEKNYNAGLSKHRN